MPSTRRTPRVLVALVAFGLTAVAVGAQEFEPRGFVMTDFDGRTDVAQDVLFQPDGKIVVAGWAQDSSDGSSGWHVVSDGDDAAVARYLPSGELDPSFSRDGEVRTDVNEDLDVAYSLARQDDGKLVVAGTTGSDDGPEGDDFLLVRYRENGSLDRSFGNEGIVRTAFESYPLDDIAYDLAIQPNGKIVAVGHSKPYDGVCCSPDRDIAVARYLQDGSLDPKFSEDGLTTTDFDGSHYDQGRAVALQPDGRIVVGGMTDSAQDFALVRYLRNGELDRSFSSDGKVTTSFGQGDDPRFCSDSGSDIIDDVVVHSSGRITAVGYSSQCTGGGFAAARYETDGELDEGFGRGGRAVFLSDGLPALGWAFSAVSEQREGLLVGARVTGKDSTRFDPDLDFGVARLRPSGRLDSSFSGDGIQAVDLGSDDDTMYAMDTRGDEAVVVGTSPRGPKSWDWGVALLRVP